MSVRWDRYGMVISDVDMSPEAETLRKALREAAQRDREFREWCLRRQRIEEHDPHTPLESYRRRETPSSDPGRLYDGSSFEDETGR